MTTLEIILLCTCSLLAIIFIVVRTLKGGVMALTLKTIASFGFVTSAVIGLILNSTLVNQTKWALGLLIIGLLLGMIGDIVLDLKVIYNNDNWYLNTGMGAFFLGHLCYITAFSLLANLESLLLPLVIAGGSSILLTTSITLSSKKIGLNFGKFLIQTIAYTTLLTFAMSYSLILALLGGGLWLTFIGMTLFFLSDIVLSFQYFGGRDCPRG